MVVYVVIEVEEHVWYQVDIFHKVFCTKEQAQAYIDSRDQTLNHYTIVESTI